jgi:hypothetical protein
MLEKFYAVTMTSIYCVEFDKERHQAKATKIALKGVSNLGVGAILDGPMMAVTKWLQFYIPEGGGLTSFQRKVEMVNTRYWCGHTSGIVALFLDEESARNCWLNLDLSLCDSRWIDSTREVIVAIGHEHPVFEVCEFEDIYGSMKLLP